MQPNNEILTLKDMASLAKVSEKSLKNRLSDLQRYGAFRFGGNGHWRMFHNDFITFLKSAQNDILREA